MAGLLVKGLKLYHYEVEASKDYGVIDPQKYSKGLLFNGWKDPMVVRSQDSAYRRLIKLMYEGEIRQDLRVAGEAIKFTGLEDCTILEVGCGSGYYSEIIERLVGKPIVYVGIDISMPMISTARDNYPERAFVLGDAAMLPFKDESFPIVFNGVSLMHVFEYKRAIAESKRVSGKWVIFHTVPVIENGDTVMLSKKAYGKEVMEWIFNETGLLKLFEGNGLFVKKEMDSIPYNVKRIVGEAVKTKTYICETKRQEDRS